MRPSGQNQYAADLRATDLPLLDSREPGIGEAQARLNTDVPIHLYDTRGVPLEGRGIATISIPGSCPDPRPHGLSIGFDDRRTAAPRPPEPQRRTGTVFP